MRHLLTLFVGGAIAAIASAQSTSNTYAFWTIAGRGGLTGSTDGAATDARFNRPWGLAFDGAGNLYITEASNHTIRKITPAGVVSTFAGRTGTQGYVDATGTSALFGAAGAGTTTSIVTGPFGIAINRAGNMYVTDANIHLLRQITPAALVSTFSGGALENSTIDGPVASARYNYPLAIAVDDTGNLFVADTYSHVIRRISTAGQVTTIAGVAGVNGSADGVGTASRFLYPTAICVAPTGNIYVADSANTIRRLSRTSPSVDSWEVTTIAGSPLTYGTADGVGAAARFGGAPSTSSSGGVAVRYPSFASPGPPPVFLNVSYTVGDLVGLAADASDNVFVADFSNNTIRKISSGGVVTTIGGSATGGTADGIGSVARFQRPAGLAVDSAGNLYIADFFNQTIRKGAPVAAPLLQAQSGGQTVGAGSNVSLSVTASGSPLPTYQWSRNGIAITGATQATLTLSNVQATDAGSYTVTVVNGLGSVTSVPMVLGVTSGPVITAHPVSQGIVGGQTVTLNVTALASPIPSYQWLRNGSPLPGQTNSTLVLANAQEATAGNYSVVVTNSLGSSTSNVAAVSVDTGRIVNLSIRSSLAGSDPLIAGFVVAGGTKPLLVRAIGPALRQFGISTAMADPQLTIQIDNTVLFANDNWFSASNATQIAVVASQVGAFPLPDAGLDAAALATISNSAVTAQASARNNTGGIVLLELYDTGGASPGRLVNVSARARVGVGENALFAGFAIGGNSPRTLLIRAIGPTLVPFGVTGALGDPLLEVFGSNSTQPRVANDNWNGNVALVAAFARVGAFPLPSASSADAALIATFEPGTYSAKISGVGNTTGEALLEIYELPSP